MNPNQAGTGEGRVPYLALNLYLNNNNKSADYQLISCNCAEDLAHILAYNRESASAIFN